MNFTAVCRTCLTTEYLNPIFVKSVDHKSYSSTIFVTTGIKVDIDDGLPQQMCKHCISFLNKSLEFRKQCKDSETRLLQVRIGNLKSETTEILKSEHEAFDNEDIKNEELQLELEIEECSIGCGDATIKTEVEDTEGALSSTEEAPCKLEPAGGAGECTHTRPGEGPRCSNSLQQQDGLKSCSFGIHIEDLHTCKNCQITFGSKYNLRNHSCTYSVEESILYKEVSESAKIHLNGDICDKQYVQKRHLVRHIATQNVGNPSTNASSVHTGETSFSDNVSKTQFRKRKALITNSGERPRPHGCDICEKRFVKKGDLTKHRKIHTGEKPFPCDVCGKLFRKRGDMTSHRRVHTGEKPYSCSVCMKQFAQPGNLSSHERIHTGEKMFSCDICEKQFAQKNRLIVHIRIHTGEKPFSCDVCKKQFSQKKTLIIHRRSHTGEKPYSCSVCQKQFADPGNLTRHMRIHTGGNLVGE